jgi:hypothetical protein
MEIELRSGGPLAGEAIQELYCHYKCLRERVATDVPLLGDGE